MILFSQSSQAKGQRLGLSLRNQSGYRDALDRGFRINQAELQSQLILIENFKPSTNRKRISRGLRQKIWINTFGQETISNPLDTNWNSRMQNFLSRGRFLNQGLSNKSLNSEDDSPFDRTSSEGFCVACEKDLSIDQTISIANQKIMPAWQCGHIKSVAHGGLNDLDNLTVLCCNCNLKIGPIHLFEYLIRQNLLGQCLIPEDIHRNWNSQLMSLFLFENYASRELDSSLYNRLRHALNPRYPIELRLKLLQCF